MHAHCVAYSAPTESSHHRYYRRTATVASRERRRRACAPAHYLPCARNAVAQWSGTRPRRCQRAAAQETEPGVAQIDEDARRRRRRGDPALALDQRLDPGVDTPLRKPCAVSLIEPEVEEGVEPSDPPRRSRRSSSPAFSFFTRRGDSRSRTTLASLAAIFAGPVAEYAGSSGRYSVRNTHQS